MNKHKNNIKNMIDKSGLKQTFIANRLGFHPADISHWISGRRYMNKVLIRIINLGSIFVVLPIIFWYVILKLLF